MTAASPPAPPDGSDPSMEEILASIRKILNEDDHTAEAASRGEPATPDEVLLLDESMIVAGETPEPPQPAPPAVQTEPVVRMEPAVPEGQAAPRAERETSGPELVAPETAAAAASSLGSLVRTLSAGRGTQVYSGGPTLEDIVRGEMRPLVKSWLDANLAQMVEATVRAEVREQLKEWLDSHLPPLVERLVRAEIERVVGRAVP